MACGWGLNDDEPNVMGYSEAVKTLRGEDRYSVRGSGSLKGNLADGVHDL